MRNLEVDRPFVDVFVLGLPSSGVGLFLNFPTYQLVYPRLDRNLLIMNERFRKRASSRAYLTQIRVTP
jgi:hypothetical protein